MEYTIHLYFVVMDIFNWAAEDPVNVSRYIVKRVFSKDFLKDSFPCQ